MMNVNTSVTQQQARYALWLEVKTQYLLPLFDFENQC